MKGGKTMDNHIVLSICIPTFNRRDVVYECVTEILNNYHKDDIAVIVVDNCSTDGTREKLAEIHDVRFKYYRNDTNTKYMNLLIALSYAEGQFSMLLSDEDNVDVVFLQELVQYLDNKKDIALVKTDEYNEMENKRTRFKCDVSSYYYKIVAVLHWGYLSGVIFNNRLSLPVLRKLKLNDYQKFLRTIGEYPHVWLALMICHRGALVFYQKALVVRAREAKSDNISDKNKLNEFPWINDRRFKQMAAMCKSFKHLQLAQLNSSEKIGLYCNRLRQLMKSTCFYYYSNLYGETYENVMRSYHPEEIEKLEYWRKQPQHVLKNIYMSYVTVNRFMVKSLWKTKTDFIKDYLKNFGSICRLYHDTIKEYQKTRKYLKEINSRSNVRGTL